jgi:hypothetical protein
MTMNYEGFDEMPEYSPDEMEAELSAEWDNMWLEICDYANQIGYSPRYVEEEFYILGELIKVNTNPPMLNKKIVQETMKQIMRDTFGDDDTDNKKFRFKPRPTSM